MWDSMDLNLAGIIRTWWEDDKVTQHLNTFRRVRPFYYLTMILRGFHLMFQPDAGAMLAPR